MTSPSVSVTPGSTLFAVIPRGPSSLAGVVDSASTAAFVAVYTPMPGAGDLVSRVELFTIRPRSGRRAAAWRRTRRTALRLRSTKRSKSSAAKSAIGPVHGDSGVVDHEVHGVLEQAPDVLLPRHVRLYGECVAAGSDDGPDHVRRAGPVPARSVPVRGPAGRAPPVGGLRPEVDEEELSARCVRAGVRYRRPAGLLVDGGPTTATTVRLSLCHLAEGDLVEAASRFAKGVRRATRAPSGSGVVILKADGRG
ncbi:hypothetical protein F4559_004812 [Saccharothrix violaceirubra]|uniref:Uncharacterized protein n=1 Tax=Saccharothrix violaceirubra TaxID=413306 RepID=A0A7W7T6H2_9PSEU|nr:hypothetical protein [Saccharothrix violaceirubra]MBB4967453.1 hypothetical protein [Saccharothrix violaceirubra]